MTSMDRSRVPKVVLSFEHLRAYVTPWKQNVSEPGCRLSRPRGDRCGQSISVCRFEQGLGARGSDREETSETWYQLRLRFIRRQKKRTMWASEGEGQVTARMETTPTMGVHSISVSQQQAPKKFAPVVAPKPKFNPYKAGDLTDPAAGDYPPPPPPPTDDGGTRSPISFPPPPPMDGDHQSRGPQKTLEERRSSLDAEIDSLTSILADLESSSPYKPRNAQNSGTLPSVSGQSAPVTGYKRMVIPTQPPLTATKKSTPKAAGPGGTLPHPASASPVARPQFQTAPQPVPASYATASTPSQPTFNVQVRSAQPGPQHQSPGPPQQYVQYMAAQPRSPDFAYGPPQPGFAPQGYSDQAFPGSGGYGGGPGNRPDPSYPAGFTHQGYQQPAPKKTYLTDPPASLAPPAPSSARPEEELERLTKKMLFDMDNPPAEEYFGRCARCGENVVGEGTGCMAMDQVFHVDCFVCVTCSGRLRGKPFYAVEKKAYCEPCYVNTLETCTVCSKPILERILRATGKAYHPHCFVCVVCRRSLDGIPFTVDAANHIHCIEDFHKKFAPRCSVCSEPIMPAPGQEETVRIVALDRDFHVQCYRCEDCGCLLSEGDNQGCYPLDGHVLCKSCNTSRIQALSAKATTDL
uniref:LIM domain containing preferred translocation partner in lipoma n=1 Tax=Esox lucius TaxID=8010 RepID=A0AAY5L2K8_ESOLU